MKLLIAPIAVTVAFALAAGGGAETDRGVGPPARLTTSGKVRWQFEALLHDTFGQRLVCATGRWAENFTAGIDSCTPLATHAPYHYEFSRTHGSAFHVTAKKASNFGNYPVAVRIRGENIACGPRETTFLIEYPETVTRTLACSGAGYVR